MRLLAALLLAANLQAAITGTVRNETTGKAQSGATVTLYKLGTQTGLEAMTNVKTAADGSFKIDVALEPGPHLIQTAWDGVTYNHMLTPADPTEGISLEVWNASAKPPEGAEITRSSGGPEFRGFITPHSGPALGISPIRP